MSLSHEARRAAKQNDAKQKRQRAAVLHMNIRIKALEQNILRGTDSLATLTLLRAKVDFLSTVRNKTMDNLDRSLGVRVPDCIDASNRVDNNNNVMKKSEDDFSDAGFLEEAMQNEKIEHDLQMAASYSSHLSHPELKNGSTVGLFG